MSAADDERSVRAHLRPGERLLWTGRPDPNRLFTAADFFLVPFSMLWCGFAIFWEVSVWHTKAPVFLRIWGAVFVTVGLYFVVGRFAAKYLAHRRTIYGLTTRRALILRPKSVRDVPVDRQAVSVIRSRRGDHATVTIGDVPAAGWTQFNRVYANTGMDLLARGSAPFAFYDVPDPEPMITALDGARGTIPLTAPL